MTESKELVEVVGNNFKIQFSKASGGLISYIKNNKESIYSPLLPHFSRPLTDNDRRGWKPQRKLKQWYNVALKVTLVEVTQPDKGII